MSEPKQMYVIRYRHDDCEVKPGTEWIDVWDSACNGECPMCGTKDIEPVDWDELETTKGKQNGTDNIKDQ